MSDIRQFGTEMSHPIQRPGARGVQASVILLPTAIAALMTEADMAERYQGLPVILDQPVAVFGLFFDADATLDEHAAEYPILFMVIGGSGYVRVGGASAPAERVHAGYAVLWPADTPHLAWTDGEPMQAIALEFPAASPTPLDALEG
ncbi:MAG TPA: hypothetical protein PLO33_12280 [Kouleothrix sp.]|nr:hypothetical protein [Kouleothrix sp.]HRC76444.1 hypothetical protein [Kouleothrix sp.]